MKTPNKRNYRKSENSKNSNSRTSKPKSDNEYAQRPKRTYKSSEGESKSSYFDKKQTDKNKRPFTRERDSSDTPRTSRVQSGDFKENKSFVKKRSFRKDETDTKTERSPRSFKPREGSERTERNYRTDSDKGYNRERSQEKRQDSKTERTPSPRSRSFKPRESGENKERSYRAGSEKDYSRERNFNSDRKPSNSGERYKKKTYHSEKSDRPENKEYINKRASSFESKPSRFSAEKKSSSKVGGGSWDGNSYNKPKSSSGVDSKPKRIKSSDEIRLNRFLSNSGVASRRDADKFISAGLVKVNGEVVTVLGTKVKPSDEVIYAGQRMTSEKKVYYILNKPKDYITTNEDPEGRKTVLDIARQYTKLRIFPIGRLDRNTTGVLILTNDGDLAQKLSHPKFGVKKIYKAELDKKISVKELNTIRNGIDLEDGFIQVDYIDYEKDDDKKVLMIEIHSGKNRIIRRIFESLNYEVVRLDRLSFAGFDKKSLKRGEMRELNDIELKKLKSL